MPRDLFDLAVLYSSDERQNLLKAMLAILEKVKAFEKAFMAEIKKPGYKMYSQENPDMLLEGGHKIAGREFELCKDFLSDIKDLSK